MPPDRKSEEQLLPKPTTDDPRAFLEMFYESGFYTQALYTWQIDDVKKRMQQEEKPFPESEELKECLKKFNEEELSFEFNPQSFSLETRIELDACFMLLEKYGNVIRRHRGLMDIYKNIVVDGFLKEVRLNIPESDQLTRGLTRALVELILDQDRN